MLAGDDSRCGRSAASSGPCPATMGLAPVDSPGGTGRPRRIEVHRMDDVGSKSRGFSEDEPLPSRQAACEARRPFGRREAVSMDPNSVADFAGGKGAGPVPEDRVDLIAGPREAR